MARGLTPSWGEHGKRDHSSSIKRGNQGRVGERSCHLRESARRTACRICLPNVSPGKVDGNSVGGQNNGLNSFAEFVPGEDIKNRIPVIVHEYAHFVFGSTQASRAAELREDILEEGGEVGGPAWGLINEGLATAIGNGRVQRLLMDEERFSALLSTPVSFYSEPFIDRAEKALLPLIGGMIADGASIHDESFPRRYVDALRVEFSKTLNSPALHLSEVAAIIDPAIDADRALNVMEKSIPSSSRWDYRVRCCGEDFMGSLNSQPGVAMVVIVPASSVSELTVLPEAVRHSIGQVASEKGVGVYVRREGSAPLIVVALRRDDITGLEGSFSAIAGLKELREGFVATSVGAPNLE